LISMEKVVEHLETLDAGLFDGEMPVLAIEGV
jgi:hypothetical protein